MKMDELERAVYEEWRNMHHNSSMSSSMPKFKNEHEYQLFLDHVGIEVSFWIDVLVESVEEKFGETLTFYQYGRMGATIAPHEYMNPAPCSSFGSLRLGHISCGLDGYNELRHMLQLFRFINAYCRGIATNIGSWWQEAKVANDYQEEIDKYGED